MRSHIAFFVLGAVILALGAFVSFSTGRYEAMLYAAVGAAACAFLGLFFRKNKMRPLFVPRQPGG